jgi:hemerythrin
MELIQLEDRLRLNIPEIDAQHQRLIELVNRLHEALLGGAEKEVRDSLLSQLIEGTQNHCAYEEALMLRYGYPEYQAHKSEHDRLKRNLTDLIERYRNGELVLSIAVVMELRCWATIHIEKSDIPLGAYLTDQNVVVAAPD